MEESTYFKIEDYLKEATGSLGIAYEQLSLKDWNEDFQWCEELSEIQKKVDYLLESMIFTFKIEEESGE